MKRVIYDRPVNHRNNSMKHQIIYTIDHTPCRVFFRSFKCFWILKVRASALCSVSLTREEDAR